jgi:hypothetical protein
MATSTGNFVGAGSYDGDRSVFIGVKSRVVFDAIPLEVRDHREPIAGVEAKQLLTKSGEITKDGITTMGKPIAEITIIFQHWLDGAEP